MSVQFEISKLLEKGWKQGDVLLIKKSDKKVYPSPLDNLGLYIIISHSCDIANHDIQKEPYVELLYAGKEIETPDSMLLNAQNPRKLHLKVNTEKYLELYPYRKYFLDRRLLLELAPYKKLTIDQRELKILVSWLAKRYMRTAFPNSFNKRVKPAISIIKKALANQPSCNHGLFIRLNTYEEIEQGEIYKLELKMFIAGNEEYERNKNKIDACFEKIIDSLSKIEGLELVKEKVLPMKEINAHEYLKLQQWDFDYLSFNEPEIGTTLSILE